MSGTAVVEAPQGAGTLPHRRVLVIIGALMLGMFLAALDQTVVATALPTIVGDLHGASHLTWVVTAYLLFSTVSTPLWGKLGDQYGRKVFFQAAIVIFLVGSMLAGLSHNMGQLIVFRSIQGLGGGGLIIGAQTIVGDVVSPRERGRYMGLFMAMFGVTTIIGPMIGGVFVEYLSWRWIFYINVPIGAVALVITAMTLPGHLSRVGHAIDYAGTLLLAGAASALILFTSLGGTSYAWGSAPELALLVGGVVLTVLFLWAESRAKEPVIPLDLFGNRVFASASAIAFVVGFAMFGAMTFLPLFFQVVKHVAPIASGVRLFPMMGGLLVASVGSGQIVSRWGRYKVFPVVGTFLMTVGLFLMSQITVVTGAWVIAGYMAIFGLGLGLVMQVLVVAVQNAVPYEELGVATSGNTFFRMIGASFGTAVFGALFSNLLASNLAKTLHGVRISASALSGADNPKVIEALPPVARHAVVLGFAHTVQDVFKAGIPVAFAAFLLSWLLPEVELRRSIRTTDAGEGLNLPEARTSLQQMQVAIDRVTRRENRAELYRTLADRAGVQLEPRACWLLYRLADRPDCTLEALSQRLGVDEERLRTGLAQLEEAGMARRARPSDDCEIQLTPSGAEAIERLTAARRQGLTELLAGWDPEKHPELQEMVKRLAHELMADDEKLLADARPARRAA